MSSFFLLSCQNEPEKPATPKYEEILRNGLELNDSQLFKKGDSSPFNGTMVEHYQGGQIKSKVEIRQGRAHGSSRGWFEDGTLEVEETFQNGVSHGQRTRWYANGRKKSHANVVQGTIEGIFSRWHENGQLSQRATLKVGQPHGLSEAWYPSGNLKARVHCEHGKVIKEEFWEDE